MQQNGLRYEAVVKNNINWFPRLFIGRICRSHYIFGLLFLFLVFVFTFTILFFIIPFLGSIGEYLFYAFAGVLGSFVTIMIPSLILRRLHDIGSSGVWLFLFMIPILGMLMSLILVFLPGNTGDNKYGSVSSNNRRLVSTIFNY